MQQTIDLEAFVDDLRLSGIHFLALAMCSLALLIDGFDLFLVGIVGPEIAKTYHEAPSHLSLVFLLQQIGVAVGAFGISPVADRIGRKKVLLFCAAAFGGLTLGTMLARTLVEFAMMRCVAGIFLGGMIPNAVALLVEIVPRRSRSLFVALAYTAYGAGSVGGALVSALLVKDHGWQISFWIGGVAPLFYVLVGVWAVHESIQFRVLRNTADPVVLRLIRRLRPALRDQALTLTLPPRRTIAKSRATDVFNDGRVVTTALIWTSSFLVIGTFALTQAWLPTLYNARLGIPVPVYSSVWALAGSIGLLGTPAIGFVLDRLRPARVLAATFAGAAAALFGLANTTFGTMSFIAAMIALIFFLGAGGTGLTAITARYYPAEIRATGVGWAAGTGRIGAILGPLAGGMMLARGYSVREFLLLLSVPAWLTVLVMMALDWIHAADSSQRPGGRAIPTDGK